MRIALLCATRRGYLLLKKLDELRPDSEWVVFSFREEAHEPPFLDDLRNLTLDRGGRFFEAKNVGSARWAPFWESTPTDLMFAVSWRYMIPPDVYRRPRQGAFVFHDSLLPAYQGFAPTVWAILNGEDHTGATLFEIAEEVDSGDIVDQQRVPIGAEDSIADVMEHVTQAYLDMLERNLDRLLDGSAPRHPQDHSRATYTCKRLPDDNRIDWSASTRDIHNLIRAVSQPYPGAFGYLRDRRVRIWSAQVLTDYHRYSGKVQGRVVEVRPGAGTVVLTGDGALLLKQVQLEGDAIACASDVLTSPSQTLT